MKLTWFLAAMAPIAIAGCSGAFLGHLAVLAVTIALFVGTLSLGRQHTLSASVTNTERVVETATPQTLPTLPR